MRRFVIVPGIFGSPADHWQSIWEQEWSGQATRIQPTSWDYPDRDDWVRSIDAALAGACAEDEIVFVAHSLGCWATAAWCHQERFAGAVGLFFVAPPDVRGRRFLRDRAPSFTRLEPEKLPYPGLLAGSTSDPHCDFAQTRSLAERWGLTLINAGSLGHLNEAAELGSWPHGQQLLATVQPTTRAR